MKSLSPLNIGYSEEQIGKFGIQNFPDAASLPSASDFKVGVAQVAFGRLAVSDGTKWVILGQQLQLGIANTVTAGTTATGQNSAFSEHANYVQVINNDATNYAIIGIGQTPYDAELAVTSGVSNLTLFAVPPKTTALIPKNNKFFAWVGHTSSVSLTISQVK